MHGKFDRPGLRFNIYETPSFVIFFFFSLPSTLIRIVSLTCCGQSTTQTYASTWGIGWWTFLIESTLSSGGTSVSAQGENIWVTRKDVLWNNLVAGGEKNLVMFKTFFNKGTSRYFCSLFPSPSLCPYSSFLPTFQLKKGLDLQLYYTVPRKS